jgi:hypothetical protein
MPAPRLTDSQKEELVARYRQGETAQALAEAYGCSPNTVSRVVRAALAPEELAALKQQRGRGSSAASPAPAEVPVAPVAAVLDDTHVDAAAPDVVAPDDADPELDDAADVRVLAIDDADDFADDGLDDDSSDDGDFGDAFVTVPVGIAIEERASAAPQPLTSGALPLSVYMLVDKTVELQAKPLKDFPELGLLPEDEQERQALMLYSNPRQAKRQCGRTQRVIKVPDSGVLERTSSYLLAQGITRLVVEGGSLYAIPGS